MERDGGAGEVRVKDGLLGVYRDLRDATDDAPMNALFDQETKLFAIIFRHQHSPSKLWLHLCHTDTLPNWNHPDQAS